MTRSPRVVYAANFATGIASARSLSVPVGARGVDFSSPHWGVQALGRQQDSRLHRLTGTTMGTTWSLRIGNPEFHALEPVQVMVQNVLDEVIAQMSNWEPQSAISRFNAAPAGTVHALPQELAQVLDAALLWTDRSGGAMNPAMGALVALWGFGPHGRADDDIAVKIPADASITNALTTTTDIRNTCRLGAAQWRQPGGVQLDLCGIAKGFAVDWVVQQLQGAGWACGLFEIGGELRTWGDRPDARAWQIQLDDGTNTQGRPMVVSLRDGALATSGDRWHHFEMDGKRYSHTIDPRTGRPVEHRLTSVSVYHDECMHADALATVLTVLGPQQGMRFAEEHAIAAVFHQHAAEGESPGRALIATPAWKATFAS